MGWGTGGQVKGCALSSLLQVRVYCDQWRRPRAPPQEIYATTVNPEFTSKKKLATEVINKLRKNRYVCCCFGEDVCVCVRGPGDCNFISTCSLRKQNQNTRKGKTKLRLQAYFPVSDWWLFISETLHLLSIKLLFMFYLFTLVTNAWPLRREHVTLKSKSWVCWALSSTS